MELSIVEGEPEVLSTSLRSWKMVSIPVGRIVVVFFMVADTRHKRSQGGPFLAEIAEDVPNWLLLAHLLRVHACVGDITSQEDKVKWINQMG